MTQRTPKSSSAQGACSREEPQPKLWPATMIDALRCAGLLRTKSGCSDPSSRYRISANSPSPSPVRLIVLRYCLGMIMSVSMLSIASGAATPVNVVNLSIAFRLFAFSASGAGRLYPPSCSPAQWGNRTLQKPLQVFCSLLGRALDIEGFDEG